MVFINILTTLLIWGEGDVYTDYLFSPFFLCRLLLRLLALQSCLVITY